jgi:rare lipoprotein A
MILRKSKTFFITTTLAFLLHSCSTSKSSTSTKNSTSKSFKKNVEASYYADKFEGRKTASGQIFSNNKLTCAHRTLVFGTKLKVINPTNKKYILVVVNDRGPQKTSREIDLSKIAFMKIADNIKQGTLKVDIEILN